MDATGSTRTGSAPSGGSDPARFVSPRAQQCGHLLQRRLILNGGRQPLLDRRALSPLHGVASDLGAPGYIHDRNTADGP
jgi:hypothetical protein